MKLKDIKMFKKTLLALAVVGISSNAFAASTVSLIEDTRGADVTTITYADVLNGVAAYSADVEGLTDLKPVVTLGVALAANDFITFTLTGATFDATKNYQLVLLTGDIATAAFDADGNNGEDIVLSATPFSQTATTLGFQVAGGLSASVADKIAIVEDSLVSAPAYAHGEDLEWPVLKIDQGAAVVKLAVTDVQTNTGLAKTSGLSVAGGTTIMTRVAHLADVTPVIDTAVEVDVNVDRLGYTDTGTAGDKSSPADGTIDFFTTNADLAPLSQSTSTFTPASLGALDVVTITMTGDMSGLSTVFMDADDDGVVDVGDSAFTISGDTATIALAGNSAHLATSKISWVADETNTLAKTTYSLAYNVNYSSAALDDKSVATTRTVSVGINGELHTIPYMPYGDNTASLIKISNTSAADASVSVRYIDDDSTEWVDLGEVVIAPAAQITDVGAVIIAAVKASNLTTKGKVALELTFGSAVDSVTTWASFKVRSETDRGFVGVFGGKNDQQ